MTVGTTTYFTEWQNANGSNKNWVYNFPMPDDDSVVVLVRDVATPLVITRYTENFTRVEVDANNGTIVYPAVGAALGASKQVRIVREVPYTQLTQIGSEGAFNPEIHEKALDKLTMLAQQLYGAAERSLRFPLGDTVTELPPVRAGKVLAFDDNGNPIAGPTPGDITNASAYATAAMGYRDQAEGYKNTAAAQAGIATTKAGEAASSAQDAADIVASLDLTNYLTKAGNLSGLANQATARSNLGLGTAAVEAAGTGANQLLKLADDGKIPALDGSLLTNIPGGIKNIQAFINSGTYNPTPGTTKAIVIATGGGGGGGSGGADNKASGAGAGATALALISNPTTQTVTIGAGASAGGVGGTTSFGALVTAVGGSGGAANGMAGYINGGNGGNVTTGALLSIPGGNGQGAYIINGATTNTPGHGGASFWGGPGSFGAGGRGSINGDGEAVGASGVVIVLEF